MIRVIRLSSVLLLAALLQIGCSVTVTTHISEPLRQPIDDAFPIEGDSCLAVKVTDEIGVSVGLAMVSLSDFEGTRLTSDTGYVYLAPVPAGEHRVTVSKPGYRAFSRVYQVAANSWACDTPVVLQNLSRRTGSAAAAE